MTTNTKATLTIAVIGLIFLATTALATTAYWSQRDKRRVAETREHTAKTLVKTCEAEKAKLQEDLRKCEAQPRITVQSGRRNKTVVK